MTELRAARVFGHCNRVSSSGTGERQEGDDSDWGLWQQHAAPGSKTESASAESTICLYIGWIHGDPPDRYQAGCDPKTRINTGNRQQPRAESAIMSYRAG